MLITRDSGRMGGSLQKSKQQTVSRVMISFIIAVKNIGLAVMLSIVVASQIGIGPHENAEIISIVSIFLYVMCKMIEEFIESEHKPK